MKKLLLLVLLFGVILLPAVVFADRSGPGLALGLDQETARMIGLDPGFVPVSTAGLSPLGSVLPDDQLEHFAKVMRWKRLTIVALGINTGAVVLSFISPLAGNIVGILSLGFYTISTGYMVFGYNDLMGAQNMTVAQEPDPRPARLAALIAAGFGMGALTALGFAFDPYGGAAATVIAYICTAVSGVSGILAIIRTNRYAEAIDYQSYADQMQGMAFSSRPAGREIPAAVVEKPSFQVSVPLFRYSY